MPDISLTRIHRLGAKGDSTAAPRLHVIFVHGLGGDPVTTWCDRGGAEDGHFWPRWLAADIEGAAIHTLGYPSDKAAWNTGWPIERAATAVLDKLISSAELRAFPNTPIAFVCHSLGGLIVKKLVVQAHLDRGQAPRKGEFLDRIVGVVFLATPHAGSIIANVAEAAHWFVSKSVHDLKASDDALLTLSHDYRVRVANREALIRHCVYYETVGKWGVKVVTPTSADPGLPDARPVAIGRDHMRICKPPSKADHVYEGVIAFLQDEILKSPSGETPINSGVFKSSIIAILESSPEALALIESKTAHEDFRGKPISVPCGEADPRRRAEHVADNLFEDFDRGQRLLQLALGSTDAPGQEAEREAVLDIACLYFPACFAPEDSEKILADYRARKELIDARAATAPSAELRMAAIEGRPAQFDDDQKKSGRLAGKKQIHSPPPFALEGMRDQQFLEALAKLLFERTSSGVKYPIKDFRKHRGAINKKLEVGKHPDGVPYLVFGDPEDKKNEQLTGDEAKDISKALKGEYSNLMIMSISGDIGDIVDREIAYVDWFWEQFKKA